MTFLEGFLIPFGVSVFANLKTDKIKSVFQSMVKDNNDPLRSLFVDSLIYTINSDIERGAFSENVYSKELIKAIKKDNTKLFLLMDKITENEKNNFLNIINEDKNGKFIKKLFSTYSIDLQDIKSGSFYDIFLENLLVNFKTNFLGTLQMKMQILQFYKKYLKLIKLWIY